MNLLNVRKIRVLWNAKTDEMGLNGFIESENAHHVKRSVRKATWFEKRKMNMIDIFIFTYLWVYEA